MFFVTTSCKITLFPQSVTSWPTSSVGEYGPKTGQMWLSLHPHLLPFPHDPLLIHQTYQANPTKVTVKEKKLTPSQLAWWCQMVLCGSNCLNLNRPGEAFRSPLTQKHQLRSLIARPYYYTTAVFYKCIIETVFVVICRILYKYF